MGLDKIVNALEDLPDFERILAAAHYCDDFQTKDISILLEMPEGIVEHRMQILKAYLRRLCDEEDEVLIMKAAFQLMFQLRKYQLVESYAWSLYNMIRDEAYGGNESL